jgi:hypothetical protein
MALTAQGPAGCCLQPPGSSDLRVVKPFVTFWLLSNHSLRGMWSRIDGQKMQSERRKKMCLLTKCVDTQLRSFKVS